MSNAESTSSMTADEAVRRAREIAARLSGLPLPASPPTSTNGVTSVAPNNGHVVGNVPESVDEPSNFDDAGGTAGKKRKRWGVMPPTEPPTISPTVESEAAKEARAKAVAAVAKAIAPGALTIVPKPKPQPITKRVWIDTNTMLSEDRPAAHYVAYGERHFKILLEKLNKDAKGKKEKDSSFTSTVNGKNDKSEDEDILTIEFKGKGATDRPPVLGMPEEPFHVHLHGPKNLVEQAEFQVEDILEQAQTAPIEEDAVNARLAAEGALTAIGGSYHTMPVQSVSTYRPASVAQLIGQANLPLEQRMLEANAPLIEEAIGVPNGIVGFIIGRGGENIASMQAKTGCKVQIQKEHELQPGQTERTITLQAGSQEAVNACKEIIENLVAERVRAVGGSSNRSSNYTSTTVSGGDKQQQATLSLDPVQQAVAIGHKMVEVDVPDADVGLVIGKGGGKYVLLHVSS
jgi:transcription antitermination factor NusA-like protein